MLTYILLIIVIALIFDFANGFNDAANSVATIVATRVLSPRLAVLWAAFFNFIAAFGFETHVARTIGKDLVKAGVIDPNLILATLLAAIIWTVFCTQKGLPISVSHSLIGAMAGAAIVKGGVGALIWSKIGVVAMFIVFSPLFGVILAWILMVAMLWLCRRSHPKKVDARFRYLQLVSAAVYSLSHGLNDAQKTMGIITALLVSQPSIAHWATHTGDPQSDKIAWWIILSCHGAIAAGTYLGGWKVVHTLGQRVTKLQPIGGFCAETGGGVTIIALSALGIPVSTTHTITGAIFGVGVTKRMSAVRWSVGGEIMTAWLLTLPAAALMAALTYFIISIIAG
ncbi:MAG: anion permease [Planctomycetota bacterium]|nr:MAG: anion permease [Planctomycetota bacterium]